MTGLRLDHIEHADALAYLKTLPDECVNLCVTSPPYFGLRDYGTATWEGGDAGCDHKIPASTLGGGTNKGHNGSFTANYSATCGKCGARRIDDQIGLEDTPAAYIARLVAVFAEVKRVLRADGNLYVNLGDSYTGSGRGPTGESGIGSQETRQGFHSPKPSAMAGLPAKSLMLIPHRFAIAMQDDGWTVREDIVWAKGNPMPECLDPQTQVFVRRNGWVSRVTLAQVADMPNLPEILSPTGWVKIRQLWKTQKPALLMEAGKVEYVTCSPDHRFPISSDRRRVKVRYETAANIRHEGYADYLLYCPIDRFLTPTLTEWMGRPLSYDLGYMLGVYTAEGGHQNNNERGFGLKLTIGLSESDFAANIHRSADAVNLPVSELAHQEKNCRDFYTYQEWFTRTVDTFVSGSVKTKALNIELLLNTPREFRQGVLDGYVDGDGSDRQGGAWTATSASRRLRDDISTLASSLGIITSKKRNQQVDKRTGKTYTSYSLWTPYMTRRKSKSGTEGIYQIPPRRRKLLNEVREMIDIEVDDHLFLIGDGLVSHNSVRDRCTRSHEYIFHFTKGLRYWYDAQAVAEPAASNWTERGGSLLNRTGWTTAAGRNDMTRKEGTNADPDSRNRRSVWNISPASYKGAHFATFPEAIPEIIILAACPEGGVVLDPFAGAGTTALVAKRLNRRYLGCDLNAEYVAMARARIDSIPYTLFSLMAAGEEARP